MDVIVSRRSWWWRAYAAGFGPFREEDTRNRPKTSSPTSWSMEALPFPASVQEAGEERHDAALAARHEACRQITRRDTVSATARSERGTVLARSRYSTIVHVVRTRERVNLLYKRRTATSVKNAYVLL